MLEIKETPDGVTFKIRVQPRASRNQLAGPYQDGVKVRLTAPPVDGEANQACIDYFAQLFGVAKAQVELIAGHTGRSKVLRIRGINAAQAEQILKC